MPGTERVSNDDDQFFIPHDIFGRALQASVDGVRVQVQPIELIVAMREADDALNGESNDAEHDALYDLREKLSGWFEDEGRRT